MNALRMLGVVVVAATACGDESGAFMPDTEASTGEEGSTGEAGAPAVAGALGGPARVRRCIAPDTVSASPETIEEAVELLNALPPPVDIACFVESLERPLDIHATTSTFSAQPSFGAGDPRVFIFSGDLVMSVVSAGDGVRLLEFGEFIDDVHTVKGEVELPMEGPIEPSDPFDRVLYREGTGCGLCHREEQVADSVGYATAFSSLAYRPTDEHRLEIEEVEHAYNTCDWAEDAQRCGILTALFGHGELRHQDFPEILPTFGS